MKKRKSIFQKMATAITLITTVTMLFPMITYANSMPTYIWGGGAVNEAVLLKDECSVEVINEVLTFAVEEFPEDYYETHDEFDSYSGEVTAEYTLYNPTDEELTIRLAFPFGNVPEYAPFNIEDNHVMLGEKEISVNGVPVDKKIRKTYTGYESFDAEKERGKLIDTYIEDEFYKPDLPVTKCVYKIETPIETQGNEEVLVTIKAENNLVVAAEGYLAEWNEENKEGTLQLDVENGIAEIFLIGKEDIDLEWTFRDWEEEKEIDGTATLTEKTSMTFEEYALSDLPEAEEEFKTDWYNAKVAYLKERETIEGILEEYDIEDFPWFLMFWYEYEITLKPGETINNKVTAPLYPSVDVAYEPPVYEYLYLLSPAKLWSDFGELEIVIDTPFYMTDCSVDGFEKVEEGYRLKRKGLPDENLEFKLSESENPKVDSDIIGYKIAIFFYVIGIPLIIVGIIAGIIIWRYKVRKKKEELK